MRLNELLDQVEPRAQLRLKIGKYRSYERDTTSGGGSTSGASSASSSGASTASTSESGGSSTPTSSGGGAHKHLMFNVINGTPLASGTERRYFAKAGSNPSLDIETAIRSSGFEHLMTYDTSAAHAHDVSVPGHQHGIAHVHGTEHDHTTPDHVHAQNYDIFEEGSLPGAVSVVLDGQNIDSLIGGPFTATGGNDTFDADLTGILTTPGWHTLRLEAASGKGRVCPSLIVKSLQLQ